MSNVLIEKKLKHWEHQLLDLGKRNKMINYRETKRTTIKLVEPSFDVLFKRIAVDEATLTFQRAVDRETDGRVFAILSLLESMSAPLPVTVGDIKTEGSVMERQLTLKNMRAKSRLALEEQGTNILYLSFGFVQWKDGKGASAQIVKSPLVLVPVSLTLKALNAPFELSRYEDDIVVNPTLEHLFKTEHGIALPTFDPDKESLSDFFVKMQDIADKHGFKIIKEVSLGLLSFLKITMYNDLLRNRERIKTHPVVRAMCGDREEANTIPQSLTGFNADDVSPRDCYQVMSADSSQQDAILYSKHGVSFVMQGPPGTGKSQTITNIIAEALAQGKKVLFVSEKMAALQVVYRRLQDAHLGDFCLPLHSYKANKKEILEQIGASLKLDSTPLKDSAIADLEKLLVIRSELNGYAAELHTAMGEMGLSCYEVYGKLTELLTAPTVAFTVEQPLKLGYSELSLYQSRLKDYALAVKRLGGRVKDNPWQGLATKDTSTALRDGMAKSLSELVECIDRITLSLSKLKGQYGNRNIEDMPSFAEALQAAASLWELPNSVKTAADQGIVRSNAAEAAELFRGKALQAQKLEQVFAPAVYGADSAAVYVSVKETIENVKGNRLIAHLSPDELVGEGKGAALGAIYDKLKTAKSCFDEINSMLGTFFNCDGGGYNTACSLLALMQRGLVIPHSFFSGNTERAKELVTRAKPISEGIRRLKAELLTTWQEGVFSLDYRAMLVRYNEEYRGLFKRFKSSYKADSAAIGALHKPPMERADDKTALQLLTGLNDYYGRHGFFKADGEWLRSSLGELYKGENSDWDRILLAIDVAEQIHTLMENRTPAALIQLLSEDYARSTQKLTELLTKISVTFGEVRSVAKSTGIALNVDAKDFNCDTALTDAESALAIHKATVKVKSFLAPYLHSNLTPITDILFAAEALVAYNELQSRISSKENSYRAMFGALYQAENSDWAHIVSLTEKLCFVRSSPFFTELGFVLKADGESCKAYSAVGEELAATIKEAMTAYSFIKNRFRGLDTLNLAQLATKAQGCLDSIEDMQAWIDYDEASELLKAEGLGDFLCGIEKDGYYEDIENAFLKGFYRMWLEAANAELGAVRRFRRGAQDERIKGFVELDDKQLSIARYRIHHKLASELPREHRLLKATDELAVLNKELNKKRGIMPLRKLFGQIPNLILKLKPCLMMSPLSVSYFLETEAYHFDLVIFDEASQIFPEDAIGAIYRGSQVIIAGDSKQLPPTNFFSASASLGEGETDTEDEDFEESVADSILEEGAAALPARTLLWHYRSKNEALIAFSNREIYGNSLITFPNNYVKMPDMGVEYVYVDGGCYEGGGKNRNVAEAHRCVALVEEHIKRHPERSLGIIAFSEKQQAVIEDAVIDFRERNPEYEWFFTENSDEPFFVKNLENVQGDERDTIIFSICYAKDKNGNMYMRFGPLGHEGGERRLNVAITRAKRNVKLVGSIKPSDIDLSRTNSEGVRMLRAYIEFAIRGASALDDKKQGAGFDSEDAFCDYVAAFLESNGYKLQRRLGCSDYKIDIAVENPKNEGSFIAGIECDGNYYVKAKTARDRDHLRRSVLENMGWRLYRVWSTEWYRNPETEGAALLSFLEEAAKGGAVPEAKPVKISDEALLDTSAEKKTPSADNGNPYGFDTYEESKLGYVNLYSATEVRAAVHSIVGAEQPVHLDIICRRIAAASSAGKVTETVKLAVNKVIRTGKVTMDKDGFVRALPPAPIKARVPKTGTTPRAMEHIHPAEIAIAIKAIIEYSFGITEEELCTECARVFGYERKGPKIKARIDEVLTDMKSKGVVLSIDGKLQIAAGGKV